jgi:hypothetical protein
MPVLAGDFDLWIDKAARASVQATKRSLSLFSAGLETHTKSHRVKLLPRLTGNGLGAEMV